VKHKKDNTVNILDKNIDSSFNSVDKKESLRKSKHINELIEKTKNVLQAQKYKTSRVNKFQPLSPSSHDSSLVKLVTYQDLYNKDDKKSIKKDSINTKRNRTFDNMNNMRSNYHSISTENSKNNSFIKNSTSRNDTKVNTNSYYKSALNEWKDRYFKLQKENDSLRNNLVFEKKKVHEYEKKLKINDKKVNNFDDVNEKLKKVLGENESFAGQYEQSELIRKEQAKLIKSLQYEVEIMRKYANISENSDQNKTQGNNETESNNEINQNNNITPVVKKKLKKKKKKSVEPGPGAKIMIKPTKASFQSVKK